MAKSDYTRGQRERLDQQIGNPRQYDVLIHPDGRSRLELVREALGVSAMELGRRMSVSYQWIRKIEHQEAEGRVRIGDLKAAAEALDCNLVCMLVPKGTSFIEIVERKKAG